MADIALVIKIPEEKYNYVKRQVAEGIDNPLKVYIANGIPYETVTEFADRCRECGREKVLDKIRAEIDKELFTYSQEVENMGDSAQKIRISLGIVRKIIDKYRKEQE